MILNFYSYLFQSSSTIMYKLNYFISSGDRKCMSFLQLLKQRWDEIYEKSDVFKYKIDTIQDNMLDSKYLLQLNPDRGVKRRPPEEIYNICQPFDRTKFNFTKIAENEILFRIIDEEDEQTHLLLVNVSPISRYHSLLCPYVNDCLPQVVTEKSLRLAFQLMFVANDRNLRIGFNSLCGLASVNHLHYHLLIEKYTLPVETLRCSAIKGNLHRTGDDYPTQAFCFEVRSQSAVATICTDAYKLLAFLLKRSVAHNIFVTWGRSVVTGRGDAVTGRGDMVTGRGDMVTGRGDMVTGRGDAQVVRVLIWPRLSACGAKQLAAFNVAVCELNGWFPIFNEHDYNCLKREDLENELRKWRIEEFDSLCEELKLMF